MSLSLSSCSAYSCSFSNLIAYCFYFYLASYSSFLRFMNFWYSSCFLLAYSYFIFCSQSFLYYSILSFCYYFSFFIFYNLYFLSLFFFSSYSLRFRSSSWVNSKIKYKFTSPRNMIGFWLVNPLNLSPLCIDDMWSLFLIWVKMRLQIHMRLRGLDLLLLDDLLSYRRSWSISLFDILLNILKKV